MLEKSKRTRLQHFADIILHWQLKGIDNEEIKRMIRAYHGFGFRESDQYMTRPEPRKHGWGDWVM